MIYEVQVHSYWRVLTLSELKRKIQESIRKQALGYYQLASNSWQPRLRKALEENSVNIVIHRVRAKNSSWIPFEAIESIIHNVRIIEVDWNPILPEQKEPTDSR